MAFRAENAHTRRLTHGWLEYDPGPDTPEDIARHDVELTVRWAERWFGPDDEQMRVRFKKFSRLRLAVGYVKVVGPPPWPWPKIKLERWMIGVGWRMTAHHLLVYRMKQGER